MPNSRPSIGSGVPSRLFLQGEVEPGDNGHLLLPYQALDVQRPPLRAVINHVDINYKYSKNEDGGIQMWRAKNSGSDTSRSVTIVFPNFHAMTPAMIEATFLNGMQTGMTSLRVKPKLQYDFQSKKFVLQLPGHVSLKVSQNARLGLVVFPFLYMLGFAPDLKTSFVINRHEYEGKNVSNREFEPDERIGDANHAVISKYLPPGQSFAADTSITLTHVEERADYRPYRTISLGKLIEATSEQAEKMINSMIEELLTDLNLPETVISCENGVIGRTEHSIGKIYVRLSDNLSQLMQASKDIALINLHNTRDNGVTIALNFLKNKTQEIKSIRNLLPITVLGNSLATSSLSYVHGLGNVCVICKIRNGQTVATNAEFVLTNDRGFIQLRLLGPDLKPVKHTFTLKVNCEMTVADSAFSPHV